MKKWLIVAAAILLCFLCVAPAFANEKELTPAEKLYQMQQADGVMNITKSRAGQVILNTSRLLATAFFMYELLKRYLKTSLGQERMNTGQLIVRMIIVVIAIGLYSYAFEGLYSLIDAAVDAVRGGDYNQRISAYHSNAFKALLQNQYADETGKVTLLSLLSNPVGIVVDLIQTIVWNSISNILAWIAQASYVFIEMYRYVWLLFLQLIGPLALATLINEDTRRIGIGWIENLVNVLLWPFWTTIIMEVQMQQYALSSLVAVDSSGGTIEDFLFAAVLHIISIFLTLNIPGLLPRIARGAGIKAG
jgi:ABC-type multidrug transport system fused ATPase/permease subunit